MPFQVNCSELIADFAIHDDEEVRELLKFLSYEYAIQFYFEFIIRNRAKIDVKNELDLKAAIDGFNFMITVTPKDYGQYWRPSNQSDIEKLIDSIEKYKVHHLYGKETEVASSTIARKLRDTILSMFPIIQTKKAGKEGITVRNIDELIEIRIKIGSGSNSTSLCYGSNGYDDSLGWYFDSNCHHRDNRNYPFFEWAEKEYHAKIRSFDGGNPFDYEEFLEDSGREKLVKK